MKHIIYHKVPGSLFHVIIPTSIEPIEDYVIAKDCAAVKQWLKATHPQGFPKGYEPVIKCIHPMLGDVFVVTEENKTEDLPIVEGKTHTAEVITDPFAYRKIPGHKSLVGEIVKVKASETVEIEWKSGARNCCHRSFLRVISCIDNP